MVVNKIEKRDLVPLAGRVVEEFKCEHQKTMELKVCNNAKICKCANEYTVASQGENCPADCPEVNPEDKNSAQKVCGLAENMVGTPPQCPENPSTHFLCLSGIIEIIKRSDLGPPICCTAQKIQKCWDQNQKKQGTSYSTN
jgi:hypothetical protein